MSYIWLIFRHEMGHFSTWQNNLSDGDKDYDRLFSIRLFSNCGEKTLGHVKTDLVREFKVNQ